MGGLSASVSARRAVDGQASSYLSVRLRLHRDAIVAVPCASLSYLVALIWSRMLCTEGPRDRLAMPRCCHSFGIEEVLDRRLCRS